MFWKASQNGAYLVIVLVFLFCFFPPYVQRRNSAENTGSPGSKVKH